MTNTHRVFSTLSDKDKHTVQEMKEHICFELGIYQEQMSVQEFESYVSNGSLTDDNAVVQLVINGEIRPEYIICIDRQVISRSGQIITFAGIEKTYGIENVKIRCVPRSTID